MRIVPLGGAHEVGASSTIVEFGKHRVLVDAGIRLGQEDDPLPDFSRIQEEAGHVDAILLTHAHIDHSGALPLIHLAFPNIPIYMTPATYSVVRILFSDSVRLMEQRYEKEGEVPLYPLAAVESCLGSIRPTPFDYPLRLAGGDVSVSFHPAGHILGASAIHLAGRSGSVLISGDISVTDQRTVPGMHAPNIEPDVIIVESTYGDRVHAHRPTQENQLVQTVAHVIESGGKVIIPAFAVGRAQEIILILRHAMLTKTLPSFPIYVDGMVQSVCDAYSSFPTYLQKHLRKSVQSGEHPFFPAGGTVHRVRTPAQRQRVLEGPPCCIISSSGMMTGGPSAFYASQLAGDSKNLIAITGYQDEEAPGRRLLDLANAPPDQRRLKFGDVEKEIHCQVQKYSLSAHADSGEISGLLGKMSPSQGVVLVHGDSDAREALATTVDGMVPCNVFLPQNGEPLEFQGARRIVYLPHERVHFRQSQAQVGPVGQALDQKSLSYLHQVLWAEVGKRGLFRVNDLIERWYGPDYQVSSEEFERVKDWIVTSPYFTRDQRRSHLFRLCAPKEFANHVSSQRYSAEQQGTMEMNLALQEAANLFPPETGLYKRGSRQEEQVLLLFFHFPSVAKQRYQKQLEKLESKTGWRVELNEMPHHAALDEFVRRNLPPGWSLIKNPSIIHEKEVVRIRCAWQVDSKQSDIERQSNQFCSLFLEETGYSLEVQLQEEQHVVDEPIASVELVLEAPLEINLAYQEIDRAFENEADKPYKKSKKKEQIVLSFLSPRVGERYKALIEGLCVRTGWPVEINKEPNQYGIKQFVRSFVPEEWGLAQEPSVYKNKEIVRIVLRNIPSERELREMAALVLERTGFVLEVQSMS